MLWFSSCTGIRSFFSKQDIVAELGSYKLTSYDVSSYLPDNISKEDSLYLSQQYINRWKQDHMLLYLAETQLSDADKDVSKELDSYRIALLKYRYEQKYINQKLDTSVTDAQIQEYYTVNKDKFILEIPILKTRFVKLSVDSPNLNEIKKKLASSDENDIAVLDSLLFNSALLYTSYGNTWVDAISFAKDFDMDYNTVLSKMRNNYISIEADNSILCIAYVFDIKYAMQIAPLEYIKGSIKDNILSIRKQKLLHNLEKDLLQQANSFDK